MWWYCWEGVQLCRWLLILSGILEDYLKDILMGWWWISQKENVIEIRRFYVSRKQLCLGSKIEKEYTDIPHGYVIAYDIPRLCYSYYTYWFRQQQQKYLEWNNRHVWTADSGMSSMIESFAEKIKVKCLSPKAESKLNKRSVDFIDQYTYKSKNYWVI